jgi:hypothetical protein
MHRIEIAMNAQSEVNKIVKTNRLFNQDVLNIDVVWSNQEIK